MAKKKSYKPSGQVFEELMKEHDETIYDVCAATGLCYSSLYNFRTGKLYLRMDGILLLAEHFDVPIERFYPGYPSYWDRHSQRKGR